MKVHISIPYDPSKNLGKAYNETLSAIPECDWACLTDIDLLFLTSDAGLILHNYVLRYPDTGIFTCFTNRVSSLSTLQMLSGSIDEETNIKRHIQFAEDQKRFLYQATQINRDISGFLMMISKSLWNEHKFTEDTKCLGVDTEYNRRIRAAGRTIQRMDGLYCFHVYRMMKGIFHKKHLL